MRIVLQVVSRASVSVHTPEGGCRVSGRLERPGLLALVGVTHEDTPETAQQLAAKIATLRILPGETSCVAAGAGVLVVSQFTLYADVRRGRRPSWSRAAPAPISEPIVDAVVAGLRDQGLSVATGEFGAQMSVELVNEGPVTIIVDSAELDRPRRN